MVASSSLGQPQLVGSLTSTALAATSSWLLERLERLEPADPAGPSQSQLQPSCPRGSAWARPEAQEKRIRFRAADPLFYVQYRMCQAFCSMHAALFSSE